jgi:hypothetical protein
MHVIGTERVRSYPPFQYLNNRSQGQDLGSPSGQAKFIAHNISFLISATEGGARGRDVGAIEMQEL